MKKPNNENIKKAKGILIVSILICSSMIGLVSNQMAPTIAETRTTIQQVQAIIDDINETLTEFNSTVSTLKGEDGVSSEAVNYSSNVMSTLLYFNELFNQSLQNFSQFPRLLEEVYSDLYEVRENLSSYTNEMYSLSNKIDTTVSDSDAMVDYLDENYNKEEYSEEDVDDLTAELVNNTEFVGLAETYLQSYCDYVNSHQKITDAMNNESSDYGYKTMKLFSYLQENETELPPPRSSGSSSNETASDNNTSQNSSETSSVNSTECDKQSRSLSSYKLASHNNLLDEDCEGDQAFEVAADMEISQIRYDFRWHHLDLEGTPRWAWDRDDVERWDDLLEPSLEWTKNNNEQTMVNLLAYHTPDYLEDDLNQWWDDLWDQYDWALQWPFNLNDRRCALWASYGYQFDIRNEFNTRSPEAYCDALLEELDDLTNQGLCDIRSFCILNEPNTKRIICWGEDNYQVLEIPYDEEVLTTSIWVTVYLWILSIPIRITITTREILYNTYTTASMARHLVQHVKYLCEYEYPNTLGETKTVVNLYSWLDGWWNNAWQNLRSDEDLDVLGFDFYKDQWWSQNKISFVWWTLIAALRFNKEFWIVECPGADNSLWGTNPKAKDVKSFAEKCLNTYHADVVGFYRIWGDGPDNPLDYPGAYNIYLKNDDSNPPESRKDSDNDYYWVKIRDVEKD